MVDEFMSATSQLFPHSSLSLSNCFKMATSSRVAASLRRAALSSRPSPCIRNFRPALQVRWKTEATTSASSEPHQPDAKGGVKDEPAAAKEIKFTSDSYANPLENKTYISNSYLQGILISSESPSSPSLRKSMFSISRSYLALNLLY